MVLENLQVLLLARAAAKRRVLSSTSVSMLSALLSSLFAYPLLMGAADPVRLTVAAAADMAPTELKLRELFEKSRPAGSVSVRFVFGSSGQLAAQIRAGAPYDVFLPANIEYARALEPTGRLVAGSLRPFARGRLALYSKSGKVASLADLAQDSVQRIGLANPAHAPYGVAARQAIENGLGVEAAARIMAAKAVLGENVRQALQFAESGNADAALVAWPLVKGRAGAILLPENLHGPIVQGAAVVRGGSGDADAEARGIEAMAFVDLLLSKAGQALLAETGFTPVMAAGGTPRSKGR